ncbi:ricin-type beta-trefoil lectin domain protein [Kitasatospora sp. NA04385]|uniref:ricin-type beta-trefoil lectin domain protein n=1 Tax=Kitasatospora sp. NA04385 TaxID=2742135 RepID=UPI001591FC4C|nr:ricin-type beta-trefoil lectin domain protein [Kitasatospora sp. NA04385]QKW17790.1 ricin-type beta-trefoil lectin domain protein [Kitasatospora sp. NA04385]
MAPRTRPGRARFTTLTAAALTVVSALVLPATGRADAATASSSSSDWAALQSLLPTLAATWSAPPTNQVTSYFPGGPLLGNGDLGAEVGGDSHSLKFYLAKNDFWNNSTGKGVHPVALGGLTLRAPAGGATSGTAYSQTQDLLNAQVTSDLVINGAPVHAVTFTSDTGDILVTKLTTSGSGPVALNVDTWTDGSNSAYPAASGVSGSTLWATRSTQSDAGSQWVARAAVATRVLNATATTSTTSTGTSTAAFSVSPGQTVTLVSSVNGGMNSTTSAADAQSAVAGLTDSSVATLLAGHQAWWKDYWLKSNVRVYDTTMEKYYYGAQYLLGSSARSGSNAPGLWGAWTTNDTPAWDGDYHLNYNVQAPYYGTFSSNRVDLVDPYVKSITDFQNTGAALLAGSQSIPVSGSAYSSQFKAALAHTTHGYLYPVGIGPAGSASSKTWWNQPSDASYAAVPMIYKQEYSPDSAYLGQTLYPFVKQTAQFWQDYLGAKQSDGKYHLMGAAYEGDWARDDSVDLAAVNLILKSAISYSQSLGVDGALRPAWQDILDHLPAYATTTYNGQNVYSSDYDRAFSALLGRTVCNLEWIHPFDQLDLDSPAAARQTAINTLTAMNSWTQGNNFAKSFGIAAQMGYPADALFAQMKSVIAADMQPNLSVAQGGGGLEAVGATDAINAMLLQSVNGTIRLFPDYPANRPAHFSNLRAKGGFLVSADYNGTTVSNVSLAADNAGGPVTVLNPWPGSGLTVKDAGGATVATTSAGDRYTFTTTGGGSYTLAPAGSPAGGALTASVSTQPAGNVDLAAEGTTDFAHWGLNGTGGFDHKGGVSQSISNLSVVGTNPLVQLTDSQVTYSWTGATPTASANATATGVYVRSVGNGFQLTVPASTVPQRLRLYLGAWSAKGKLTASLSDGSTAPYTGYFDSPSGNAYGVADLTFAALSAGQTLTVQYVETASYSGSNGNITLSAATLAPAVPPAGPTLGATSGKCIDITGGNSADGTALQVYGCNGSAAQSWSYPRGGTIQAVGKCMDVRGGSSADGTAVQLYSCASGAGAQQWTYTPATGQLKALGKCLDTTGGATADGTKLIINTCNGSASQRWRTYA